MGLVCGYRSGPKSSETATAGAKLKLEDLSLAVVHCHSIKNIQKSNVSLGLTKERKNNRLVNPKFIENQQNLRTINPDAS